MGWRPPHNPTAYDDDWEDQPTQGPFFQWGLGVALPLALFAYGGCAIASHQVMFGGRSPMILHGPNAIALGVAGISAGVFAHCHFCWGNVFDQAWFAVLGKIIAACGFIAALGFILVRNGVLGIE